MKNPISFICRNFITILICYGYGRFVEWGIIDLTVDLQQRVAMIGAFTLLFVGINVFLYYIIKEGIDEEC